VLSKFLFYYYRNLCNRHQECFSMSLMFFSDIILSGFWNITKSHSKQPLVWDI
jgi:hypothetical protein